MPTSKVSENQVISLIDQLSSEEKRHVLDHLLLESDASFASASKIGKQAFDKICRERNLQPGKMTEEEKLSLVDKVLHESN